MNRQYSETFIVRATDCDVQRRMRPAALFVAMQEGGERHAITLGAGYDAMMARGLFFALTSASCARPAAASASCTPPGPA